MLESVAYIAALIKTAQKCGNSSGKVAFNRSIFSLGVSSFNLLQQSIKIFFYLPLPVSLHSFYFNARQ